MVAGKLLARPVTSVNALSTLVGRVVLILCMLTLRLLRSRAAIKKYVLANNKSLANSSNVFDAQFNKAIRTGVEKGEFMMPKGKLPFYVNLLVLTLLLHLCGVFSSISRVILAFKQQGMYPC